MKLNAIILAGALAAGCTLLSAPATAQKAGGPVSAGGNSRLATARMDPAQRFEAGVALLQKKDFAKAAIAFHDVLEQDQRNANANYMMGVTQIGLEDLGQARLYLSMAVRNNPKLVDARGKLGYVLAKLGDADGAWAQRAELARLDTACGGACPDAKTLATDIAVIDKALPGGSPS